MGAMLNPSCQRAADLTKNFPAALLILQPRWN
jgi:hypothetical protein